MPFNRNWVEELAMEWLIIDGFLVESNVRLSATRAGGVYEADLVGAKIENNRLKIKHVETGSLAGNPEKNFSTVMAKFNDANRKDVEDLVKEKVGWKGDVDYEAIYIASYAWKVSDLQKRLRDGNIELHMLEKPLLETILDTIDRWKNEQRSLGRRKTTSITLPDPFWLLALIDHLQDKDILPMKKR